jgi:hypothetical protein
MDSVISPEPNVYEAVMIAEGVQPASEEEQIAAWQLLVNNGLAFTLQGWFGRTARALIERGVILPPQ